MGVIGSNKIYELLIAAALAAVTALVFFVLESRRTRHDRREEYFLDSASDLADRIWDTLIALRAHAEAPVPWPEVRRTALVLRAGLLGQKPRYRLAGVDAASEAVTNWLGSFVSYWASTQGREHADRVLLEDLAKFPPVGADEAPTGPVDVVPLAARMPFTVSDVDRALLEIYRESLDKLEDLVLAVLEILSNYTPGEVALQVSPPAGSWPDYAAARETATTGRLSRDSAG